ncbi:hypothetical protein QBC37DRAFT_422473 [Rhypophila decipiens]|uniref:Uncharacterized protein n=1 Tax=Rhypophila decipiens TaxID=261697 RepID=A0AAN6YD45_9PEZI|nr:hypothetical protein QBC37DRAFT_422473 [Rhypophila decipiens]
MARTKQTSKPRPKRPMTWTRFRLPPTQDPPNWSSSSAAAGYDAKRGQFLDILDGVPGTSSYDMAIGKMVEDPQEAVCIIGWEFMDDVTNFIASPACDRFLRTLDGMNEADIGKDDNTLDEAADSSKPTQHTPAENDDAELIARRRNRFLVLKHWESCSTSEIIGRVTLSTYLMAMPDDSFDTLHRTFLDVEKAYGAREITNVWFYTPRSWSAADEQEDMSETWMEKTFGRGGGTSGAQSTSPPPRVRSESATAAAAAAVTAGGSASDPPKKGLICNFHMWETFRPSKMDVDREDYLDRYRKIKENFDRVTGEWISDGRMLSGKRDLWDFLSVSEFVEMNRERKRKRDEGIDLDSEKLTTELHDKE